MAISSGLRYHGRIFFFGSLVVLVMAMLFVWSPWYGPAFVLLMIGGIGQSGFSTMQSTITMLSAPQEMRGRMMGLLSVCIGTGTPLGAFEMGLTSSIFAIRPAIFFNAMAGFLLLIPILMFAPLVTRPLLQPDTTGAAG